MDDETLNASPERQPAPNSNGSHGGMVTFGKALALTAAVSLLIGLVVGPIISGHPAVAADPTSSTAEHVVTVSGSGEVSVAPDVADVVIGVQVTKPTVAEAQSAAATSMSAVVAAIKKDGVDPKDIVTVNLSLNPVYEYNGSTSKLTGQQFVNTVRVTVRDLTKVAAIVDDSVTAGASTIQGITFRLNNPKTVEAQARQLAMQDARAKADALVSSAGVSIKGVASITETTSQTPIYYASGAALDKAASVSTPIQTGTTDIMVNVTVSYLIG
jgi:uncharacterized protein